MGQSETMHNMSEHQLPQYYQRQWVPSMIWTALGTTTEANYQMHTQDTFWGGEYYPSADDTICVVEAPLTGSTIISSILICEQYCI